MHTAVGERSGRGDGGGKLLAANRALEWMIAGEDEQLLALFAADPLIDEPRGGRFVGEHDVREFLAEMRSYLVERSATARHIQTTLTSARAVAEHLVTLQVDGETIELPVAVVSDAGRDGLTAMRVYYSTWPINRSHKLRRTLLPTDVTLALPGPINRYMRALADGDLDAIQAQFTEGAVVREPSGGEFHYEGREERRRFYEKLFSAGGGISLDHCTMTCDGKRCAIEYTVTRWGRHAIPPQAGVAVYDIEGGELLSGARIYDDIDAPGPVL